MFFWTDHWGFLVVWLSRNLVIKRSIITQIEENQALNFVPLNASFHPSYAVARHAAASKNLNAHLPAPTPLCFNDEAATRGTRLLTPHRLAFFVENLEGETDTTGPRTVTLKGHDGHLHLLLLDDDDDHHHHHNRTFRDNTLLHRRREDLLWRTRTVLLPSPRLKSAGTGTNSPAADGHRHLSLGPFICPPNPQATQPRGSRLYTVREHFFVFYLLNLKVDIKSIEHLSVINFAGCLTEPEESKDRSIFTRKIAFSGITKNNCAGDRFDGGPGDSDKERQHSVSRFSAA
ncbi:hypothetical protein SCHPADRAFT_885141 [Schizopora paradoxa]|uniref:Uncharacterized protein n=1 Tax=Schizopora paradoxa TaxID=27342 RepID=A0A0H2S6M2_9AGAM|nr:hypothetical protein SCHPADRAFT_885141 [Schizopora paradoxa]